MRIDDTLTIVPELSRSSTGATQYSDILDRCMQLRNLFNERGIRFHRDSELARIIRKAEHLLNGNLSGPLQGNVGDVLNLLYAHRVAQSILIASSDAGAWECVRRIAGNRIGSLDRMQSMGKDALWELELATALKGRGACVSHAEPDLVIEFDAMSYSIACKKIYSEKGVEAQVRKAAKQIKISGLHGIVALNIDELAPEDCFLTSRTDNEASEFITQYIKEFLRRHMQKMSRFILEEKCDAVLVTTTQFTRVSQSDHEWKNHTQSLLWTIKDVSGDRQKRVRVFAGMMKSDRYGSI